MFNSVNFKFQLNLKTLHCIWQGQAMFTSCQNCLRITKKFKNVTVAFLCFTKGCDLECY